VGYSTAVMALFVFDEPLSARQRSVNWGALLVLSLGGIVWGLEFAKQYASITSGYAAQYDYAIIVFVAIGLFILAVPPLIYWRTRWIGFGLAAGSVVSVLAFGIGMKILLKENRVAWQHPRGMVSISADSNPSAVIYFKKDVTDQQVEAFTMSVLMEPAMPRHQGLDFPPFVSKYFRLTPNQINGLKAIALSFSNDAPINEQTAYVSRIRADSRVETVLVNTPKDSIRADSTQP
jgi:hypothetical protein